ncbi:hypothetical protein C8A05DRAFT_42394 [Staphylotrichum tortipilum]|uniref:Rho-GAP domain-containing protein n=1 Tax=Staphylotrichum tortipilum TaxID=2831512 RepID=A0AAN6MQ95_9PEZI|nr:hypothetical protein C8A05DRAFT_42394 [Staphylotrichum longicolle]
MAKWWGRSLVFLRTLAPLPQIRQGAITPGQHLTEFGARSRAWRGSVSAGCSAASEAIANASLAINKFVRDVRESRAEFDTISIELHSLDGVLDLLRYDAAFFPAALAEHTPATLEGCAALVRELEGCVALLNRPGVSRADKKSRWLASRVHIGMLWRSLGDYTLVLGLAADLIGVTKPQDGAGEESGDDELSALTARIIEVTSALEQDVRQNMSLESLGRYLPVLRAHATAHTKNLCIRPNVSQHQHGGSSSLGSVPDSAIDVTYDRLEGIEPLAMKHTPPPSTIASTSAPTTSPPSPRTSFEPWDDEIIEFVDELNEMPIHAPAIPPRSASRLGAAPTACSSCPASPTSPTVAPRRRVECGYCTPVTELPEQDEPPPRAEVRSHSRRSSVLGQALYSVWENPRPNVPSPAARPATSGCDMPSTHQQDGLLRRSSSKLSTTLRHLSLRRPSRALADRPAMAPNAVFGVPLTQSIRLAKGVASTKHCSGGTSRRAARDYPLCMLRCVYHIRSCGLDAPDLFGVDGDQLRLGQLKEAFNSPETGYGKELDWSAFTVYDAASLILLFLAELPKPVISESVGKHWISLSRQATIRGARLDQGIDFWEEALMGIHGPRRGLFKLLLNLWGDIADAADVNGMTAERLAGWVVRPLLRASDARLHTDLLLGLAFLIRKRSEYNLAAKGVPRKSRAVFY